MERRTTPGGGGGLLASWYVIPPSPANGGCNGVNAFLAGQAFRFWSGSASNLIASQGKSRLGQAAICHFLRLLL